MSTNLQIELKPYIFCPLHNEQIEALLMKENKDIVYRGIPYNINFYFYYCGVCGESFTTNDSDGLTLNQIPNYGNDF